MKYRSRTDIVTAILESASGGTHKTRIMYTAFLSYAQVKEYLTMLLQKGLLQHDEGRNEYRTTPKGLHFLETSERLGKMMTPNQPVESVEAI